jgi:hypothetical protein
MDLTSFLVNLVDCAAHIDAGRKGLATTGEESKGHIRFDRGISGALAAFQDASNRRFATAADPQTIVLAESVFLQQELQFCGETAKATRTSLTRAVQEFGDALLAYEAVQDKRYIITEKHFSILPNSGIRVFQKILSTLPVYPTVPEYKISLKSPE